jgi:hypothetical protein
MERHPRGELLEHIVVSEHRDDATLNDRTFAIPGWRTMPRWRYCGMSQAIPAA